MNSINCNNKDNRGGFRPGAGRKRKYKIKTVPIRVRIDRVEVCELIQLLDAGQMIKMYGYLKQFLPTVDT